MPHPLAFAGLTGSFDEPASLIGHERSSLTPCQMSLPGWAELDAGIKKSCMAMEGLHKPGEAVL
jgi:hypothetical protein